MAPERLVQGSAAERGSASRESGVRAQEVSGVGDPRPRRSIYGSRQQAPSDRRGPERLCGGLPVGRAPVPVIAPGLQRGRAVGNREAGIAQPTGGRCAVRQAGGEQRGDED